MGLTDLKIKISGEGDGTFWRLSVVYFFVFSRF
jgi:hypothetical protein